MLTFATEYPCPVMVTLIIDMLRFEYTSGQVAISLAAAVIRRTEVRYQATIDFSSPLPLFQVDCTVTVITSVIKVGKFIKANIVSHGKVNILL